MYRSKLEKTVADKLGAGWDYEAVKIEYVLEKTYLADFAKGDTIVEVKGFFRPGDQAKYLAVRDTCVENGLVFMFVFSDPNKPVRRKAKMTMSEWCDKHNIPWKGINDL